MSAHSRLSGWLLWLSLPVFNTLNQVAMKLTAGELSHIPFGVEWFVQGIQTPYLWLSFGTEIINFAIWLVILKRHDLSHAFPLTAISYAALMLTSWFIFHEAMEMQQVLGVIIIMIGILVMGFKNKSTA